MIINSKTSLLEQARLWQIYYHGIKKIIEQKLPNNKNRLSYYINCFLIFTYLFEVARLLTATYFLTKSHLNVYKYDVFLDMLARNNVADSTIFLAISGLPLSAAYFNYAIYLRISQPQVQSHESDKVKHSQSAIERSQLSNIIYDLTVLNVEQMLAGKCGNALLWSKIMKGIKGFQFFNPLREIKFWGYVIAIWRSKCFLSAQTRKREGHFLPSLPEVSLRVRSQTLLIQIVCEIFHTWGLDLICKIFFNYI